MAEVHRQLAVFIIVAGIISVAGILVCCLGLFFTMPLGIVIMAMMYRAAFPLTTETAMLAS